MIPFDDRIERDWPLIDAILDQAIGIDDSGDLTWRRKALRNAVSAWRSTRNARDKEEGRNLHETP